MKNKGFTMLELIAVILVLAVVGLITVPLINKTLKNAKVKIRNEQIENVIDAAKKWNIERLANYEENTKIGNDIAIILDISVSMKTNDRGKKTIEELNEFIIDFMEDNEANRITLVVFSTVTRTKTIMPLDHYDITSNLFSATTAGFTLENGVYRSSGAELTSEYYQFIGGTYTQLGIEKGVTNLINGFDEEQIATVVLLTDGDPRAYTTNYTNVVNGTPIYIGGSTGSEPFNLEEISYAAYNTLLTANYYKKKYYNDKQEHLNFFTMSFELNYEDLSQKLDSEYNIAENDINQYLKTIMDPSSNNIELLSKFEDDTLSRTFYDILFSNINTDKGNYAYTDHTYNIADFNSDDIISNLNQMIELAGMNVIVSIDDLVTYGFLEESSLSEDDADRITGVVRVVYNPIKGKYSYEFYNDIE